MQSIVRDQEKFMSDTATIVQLPWLAVFDQDIPARILSAVSYGTGFVILSESPGAPGQPGGMSESISAIVSRLHEADFVSTALTAPLHRLSMLQDAIGDAMTAKIASGQPLVVVIRQAEALSDATLQRLIALAGLRQDGQPVLRFLLTGTSGLWPMLHGAGLGHLEDDPAAHIRLTPAAGTSALEPVPHAFANTVIPPRTLARPNPYPVRPFAPVPQSLGDRLRESLAGHGTALARLVLLGIGLAGIGAAGWFILAPGPAPEPVVPGQLSPAATAPVVTITPDARFAALIDKEKREVASHHLSSPPGDNLIETRRQIDELLPLVSTKVLHSLTEAPAANVADETKHPADLPPVPAPLPVSHDGGAAVSSLGDIMHVTLRYSRGDKAAEARAGRLLALLQSRGILADAAPAGSVIERSGLAYYFDQDRTAALALAQQLPLGVLPDIPQNRKPMTSHGSSAGAPLPRPGEIAISIGSRNDLGEIPLPSGKQT